VTERRLKKLAADLEDLAANATSIIKDACNKLHSSHAIKNYFNSDVQSLYFSEIRDDLHQEKLLGEYQHAVQLGCVRGCVNIEDPEFSWNISSKFLCTKNLQNSADNGGENCSIFSEILRDLLSLQSGAIQVDEKWYVLWQVVRVVHYFATRCVEWNVEGKCTNESIYSLERLCLRVGINVEEARNMLCQEMVPRLKPIINKRKIRRNPTIRFVNEQRRRTKGPMNCQKNLPLYEETDNSLPEGWHIEHKRRLTGKHIDRYWFTKTKLKLRSRPEVQIFLTCLEKTANNEDEAFKLLLEEKSRLRSEKLKAKRSQDHSN